RREIGGVRIPRVDFGIAVGHRGPIHLHEARAGLDEPPREQQSLSESGAAVAVANLVGLLGEIERIARFTREHQVESLPVILIDSVALERLFEIGHGIVDAFQEFEAILEALWRNLLAK